MILPLVGKTSIDMIDFRLIYSYLMHVTLDEKSQKPVSGLNRVGSLHSNIMFCESVWPHFMNLEQLLGCGITRPKVHSIWGINES